MKQSAVEWLVEQLTSIGQLEIPKGSNVVTLILEKAKEMENQQLDEFAIGFAEWCDDNYFRMGNTSFWVESLDWDAEDKLTTKELLEQFKNK